MSFDLLAVGGTGQWFVWRMLQLQQLGHRPIIRPESIHFVDGHGPQRDLNELVNDSPDLHQEIYDRGRRLGFWKDEDAFNGSWSRPSQVKGAIHDTLTTNDPLRAGLATWELYQPLANGFFASPRLGATAMALPPGAPGGDGPLDELLKQVPVGTARPVLVVGSISGGTGAGVIPELFRSLRPAAPDGPLRQDVRVLAVLPWHTGESDGAGHGHDKNTLITNALGGVRELDDIFERFSRIGDGAAGTTTVLAYAGPTSLLAPPSFDRPNKTINEQQRAFLERLVLGALEQSTDSPEALVQWTPGAMGAGAKATERGVLNYVDHSPAEAALQRDAESLRVTLRGLAAPVLMTAASAWLPRTVSAYRDAEALLANASEQGFLKDFPTELLRASSRESAPESSTPGREEALKAVAKFNDLVAKSRHRRHRQGIINANSITDLNRALEALIADAVSAGAAVTQHPKRSLPLGQCRDDILLSNGYEQDALRDNLAKLGTGLTLEGSEVVRGTTYPNAYGTALALAAATPADLASNLIGPVKLPQPTTTDTEPVLETLRKSAPEALVHALWRGLHRGLVILDPSSGNHPGSAVHRRHCRPYDGAEAIVLRGSNALGGGVLGYWHADVGPVPSPSLIDRWGQRGATDATVKEAEQKLAGTWRQIIERLDVRDDSVDELRSLLQSLTARLGAVANDVTPESYKKLPAWLRILARALPATDRHGAVKDAPTAPQPGRVRHMQGARLQGLSGPFDIPYAGPVRIRLSRPEDGHHDAHLLRMERYDDSAGKWSGEIKPVVPDNLSFGGRLTFRNDLEAPGTPYGWLWVDRLTGAETWSRSHDSTKLRLEASEDTYEIEWRGDLIKLYVWDSAILKRPAGAPEDIDAPNDLVERVKPPQVAVLRFPKTIAYGGWSAEPGQDGELSVEKHVSKDGTSNYVLPVHPLRQEHHHLVGHKMCDREMPAGQPLSACWKGIELRGYGTPVTLTASAGSDAPLNLKVVDTLSGGSWPGGPVPGRRNWKLHTVYVRDTGPEAFTAAYVGWQPAQSADAHEPIERWDQVSDEELTEGRVIVDQEGRVPAFVALKTSAGQLGGVFKVTRQLPRMPADGADGDQHWRGTLGVDLGNTSTVAAATIGPGAGAVKAIDPRAFPQMRPHVWAIDCRETAGSAVFATTKPWHPLVGGPSDTAWSAGPQIPSVLHFHGSKADPLVPFQNSSIPSASRLSAGPKVNRKLKLEGLLLKDGDGAVASVRYLTGLFTWFGAGSRGPVSVRSALPSEEFERDTYSTAHKDTFEAAARAAKHLTGIQFDHDAAVTTEAAAIMSSVANRDAMDGYADTKEQDVWLICADLGGGTLDLAASWKPKGVLLTPADYPSFSMGSDCVGFGADALLDAWVALHNPDGSEEQQEVRRAEYMSTIRAVAGRGAHTYDDADPYLGRDRDLANLYYDLVLEYIARFCAGLFLASAEQDNGGNALPVGRVVFALTGNGWKLGDAWFGGAIRSSDQIRTELGARIRRLVDEHGVALADDAHLSVFGGDGKEDTKALTSVGIARAGAPARMVDAKPAGLDHAEGKRLSWATLVGNLDDAPAKLRLRPDEDDRDLLANRRRVERIRAALETSREVYRDERPDGLPFVAQPDFNPPLYFDTESRRRVRRLGLLDEGQELKKEYRELLEAADQKVGNALARHERRQPPIRALYEQVLKPALRRFR